METEAVLNNLEKSVKRTDSHLDKIAWKLDECEKEVIDITYDENKESESVLHLLETVTQVKQHYENLRKEISEVQELQKQVQDSLRDSTAQVQTRCRALRMKLIGYQ
ncbi:uncharacterized protein LOC124369937 [Homalodisca vitripennis]|uniref:Ska2 N-terminal domain-containing protein n=1 Tax=Homalodisca liturata TaxID=320908 RepID=A0A1B6K6S6_9HEMI|nr:uncharacterized protein LOC124369937 [Homalodisca vitripennis]